MDYLTEILKSPLVQGFGILLLTGLGQKMGIPVVDIAKKLLGINGANKQDLIDYKVEETKTNLAKLAEVANHNFTTFNETFDKHTQEDAKEAGKNEEFRQEVREFIRESRRK